MNASSVNGIANGCTGCKKDRHQRKLAKAHAQGRLTLARHIAAARSKKTIYRDVAVRYLQRFGGSTYRVQTDVDTAELYLEDAKGRILGKVSEFDKYPKQPDCDFSTMPF